MFERFTDRARRVVVLAQEEARMLNHNYIGTEHILLGLALTGVGRRVTRRLPAYGGRDPAPAGGGGRGGGAPPTTGVPDHSGRTLTRAAGEGKPARVMGREKEIGGVMRVLSRRTKNN